MAQELNLTGDREADALLSDNPFALLVGMLLDQQVPMEVAFTGPLRVSERIDGDLDPATIAAMEPDDLEAIFRDKPAIHRYPGSMAKRVHALATSIVEEYDGDAAAIWRDAGSGAQLKRRLTALPGFGDQKSRIFVALLGKQYGVTPEGWRDAAGEYGEPGYRSIADVVDEDALLRVREFKRARKQSSGAA